MTAVNKPPSRGTAGDNKTNASPTTAKAETFGFSAGCPGHAASWGHGASGGLFGPILRCIVLIYPLFVPMSSLGSFV